MCPTMWTGSTTAFDHPSDLQLPPEPPVTKEGMPIIPFLHFSIKVFPRTWLHSGGTSSWAALCV